MTWRSVADLLDAQTQAEVDAFRHDGLKGEDVYECGVGSCGYASRREEEMRSHRGGAHMPRRPTPPPVSAPTRLSPSARAARNAEIRARFAAGESRFELGAAFGLSWARVDQIVGKPRA